MVVIHLLPEDVCDNSLQECFEQLTGYEFNKLIFVIHSSTVEISLEEALTKRFLGAYAMSVDSKKIE